MPDRLHQLTPPARCMSIEEVRSAIDSIDHLVVEAIGKRFQYVQEVTRFKRTREDVQAVDRYNTVLQRRRQWAVEFGLNPDVIEEMYRNLIGHFINHELTVLDLHEDGQPPNGHAEADGV